MQKTLNKFIFSLGMAMPFLSFANQYDFNNACIGDNKKTCRPPQFVHMAFDGAKSIEMWGKTRNFAKKNNVEFTYFVSGVYLLGSDVNDNDFHKSQYLAPGLGAGRSNIGFGKSMTDIIERYKQMALAHSEGHEISSHGMGHFYGGAKNRWKKDALDWSYNQWRSEFSQTRELSTQGFYKLHKRHFKGLGIQKSLDQIGQEIEAGMVGFRAPQLSNNESMYHALRDEGLKYDTSKQNYAHKWPKRITARVWDFGLAMIPVKGHENYITSMDYNFHVKKVSLENTIEAYLKYFQKNYNGNRAPVHLGHHFAAYGGYVYNDGIKDPKFWYALKAVARKVCGLPEVHCTNYRNLERFMTSAPQAALDRFQEGNFNKGRKVLVASTMIPAMGSQLASTNSTSNNSLKVTNVFLTEEKAGPFVPGRTLTKEEVLEGRKNSCGLNHDH